jgi:hypothetical protein
VPLHLRTTLLALLACIIFLPALAVSADDGDPGAPLALPAVYLPLVTAGGASADLSIAHLEITQATQNASNSVPLVADKPTVARVFVVRSGEAALGDVSVTLSATRGGQALPGSPLSVGPKRVGSQAARGDYGGSFNVLLPPSWLSGDVALTVTVDVENRVGESNEGNNVATAHLAFGQVSPLEIVVVPVRYTHMPNGRTYPPPTLDTISGWVLRSFPVSRVDVSFRAPLDFAGDLGTGAAWETLLEQVTSVKFADGAPARQVYYALVPTQNGADRWFSGGYAGIGWVGLRAAASLEFGPGQEEKTGRIAAHEIGHNLGRYHAPCGTSADPRQPYPYAGASIGAETYGLDVSAGRVWAPGAPDNARDVMSYCSPQWVSDYTYTALYQSLRDSSGSLAEPMDGLLVRGRLARDGSATLRPVYPVSGVPLTPAAEGDYAIELLDGAGGVIARHEVAVAEAEAPHAFDLPHGHSESRAETGIERIYAVLPRPAAPVVSVRLVPAGGGEPKASRALASTSEGTPQPAVGAEARITAVDSSTLRLSWLPADRPALVRYSADGRSWTTLAVDLNGGELLIDPRDLPAGAGHFEVTPAGGSPMTVALPETDGAGQTATHTRVGAP